MGLTIKSDDKGIKVIRQDKTTSSGNSFATYSLMVSSKDKDGNWVNGFVDCKFKSGVDIPNKAKIKINNAFYVVDEYKDRKYPKIMITDYELLEGQQNTSNDEFMVVSDSDDEVPFFLN